MLQTLNKRFKPIEKEACVCSRKDSRHGGRGETCVDITRTFMSRTWINRIHPVGSTLHKPLRSPDPGWKCARGLRWAGGRKALLGRCDGQLVIRRSKRLSYKPPTPTKILQEWHTHSHLQGKTVPSLCHTCWLTRTCSHGGKSCFHVPYLKTSVPQKSTIKYNRVVPGSKNPIYFLQGEMYFSDNV